MEAKRLGGPWYDENGNFHPTTQVFPKNNIFENAYFGKAYKTRDGRKAIFWHNKENFNFCLLDQGIHIYNNNGISTYSPDNYIDIVSEWQEEISEEKLEKSRKENKIIPCYKCDYRKECDYYVSGESVICKISGCKTPDESVQIEFRKNFE